MTPFRKKSLVKRTGNSWIWTLDFWVDGQPCKLLNRTTIENLD